MTAKQEQVQIKEKIEALVQSNKTLLGVVGKLVNNGNGKHPPGVRYIATQQFAKNDPEYLAYIQETLLDPRFQWYIKTIEDQAVEIAKSTNDLELSRAATRWLQGIDLVKGGMEKLTQMWKAMQEQETEGEEG